LRYKFLAFSIICQVYKILSSEINGLSNSLKIEQLDEMGQIQGKFTDAETFSAGLSTETVDFFPLAPPPGSLQRRARIAELFQTTLRAMP
jgi:hypothetical protein